MEFETMEELFLHCLRSAMEEVVADIVRKAVDDIMNQPLQAVREVVRESEGWEGF